MALDKKSWQDHLTHSFGQIDEPARSRTGNDGLIIGGICENSGTVTAVEHGDFAALHFDNDQNLMVNVVSGEIIASLGTVDVVKAGSVVVTAGTITTGTITALTKVAEYIGTITIPNLGSAGTITCGTTGLMRNITIVTGDLDGTGTTTLKVLDSKGGTVFAQTQADSAITNYGSIVPLATTMSIQAHANANQTADVSVVFDIHHER